MWEIRVSFFVSPHRIPRCPVANNAWTCTHHEQLAGAFPPSLALPLTVVADTTLLTQMASTYRGAAAFHFLNSGLSHDSPGLSSRKKPSRSPPFGPSNFFVSPFHK